MRFTEILKTDMQDKDYWHKIKLLFWMLFICLILIVCFVFIFGRSCGFKNAIYGFSILGVFFFVPIILCILFIIFIDQILKLFKVKEIIESKKEENN
jgi:hypothetical protein